MSLAGCTALLVRAVNENSVSSLEFAKRIYSEHQLLASLVQCNEAGETPLVIAMRGRNECVIDELVKVLRICDRTIDENQLKLSIAIQQLSHEIPIMELIGYLTSDILNSHMNYTDYQPHITFKWLKFIAQIFKESTCLMQKEKIIIAMELIGAISMEFGPVSSILFGLECWKVAMTLRYYPQYGQPLLPKLIDVSVSSEASSLVYGSAIEVMSLEELDIFKGNFENGFQLWCFERIKIQALLVLRRISTQANLDYPHWLYLKSLFDLADFYFGSNYKLGINVNLLIMEQLNGFDPKLLPRKTFYFFTRTISQLSEIFFEILQEFDPDDDDPARKELNFKNLLAPTEFITTISKCFSHPAMISSIAFWNTDILYYSFAEIVFRFLVVLDEISPQMSNQEKQKLEEYYSNYIRNFFPRRTFNVLHAAMYRYVSGDFEFLKLPPSSPSSITNLILKLGADPNDVDEFGQSPLFFLTGNINFSFGRGCCSGFPGSGGCRHPSRHGHLLRRNIHE